MSTEEMKALSAEEMKAVNGGCSNCIIADIMGGIFGENNPLFPMNTTCHTDMGGNFPH